MPYALPNANNRVATSIAKTYQYISNRPNRPKNDNLEFREYG